MSGRSVLLNGTILKFDCLRETQISALACTKNCTPWHRSLFLSSPFSRAIPSRHNGTPAIASTTDGPHKIFRPPRERKELHHRLGMGTCPGKDPGYRSPKQNPTGQSDSWCFAPSWLEPPNGDCQDYMEANLAPSQTSKTAQFVQNLHTPPPGVGELRQQDLKAAGVEDGRLGWHTQREFARAPRKGRNSGSVIARTRPAFADEITGHVSALFEGKKQVDPNGADTTWTPEGTMYDFPSSKLTTAELASPPQPAAHSHRAAAAGWKKLRPARWAEACKRPLPSQGKRRWAPAWIKCEAASVPSQPPCRAFD